MPAGQHDDVRLVDAQVRHQLFPEGALHRGQAGVALGETRQTRDTLQEPLLHPGSVRSLPGRRADSQVIRAWARPDSVCRTV